MCGFVGVASKSTQTSRTWLNYGNNKMFHRGPDGEGEWWSKDGQVGLAHRRLSVIDLSKSANQPMHNIDCNLSIVFNGEIYNFRELRSELETKGYKFETSSDTEVLLASYSEWGKNCVSHFNGMFAFAIYDFRDQVLFLARDRAGEKPLFYHHLNGVLHFSSELKALFSAPTLKTKIDLESLDCYLAMGYVPGDRCMIKGFNKLPPAHSMQFDLKSGKTKIWRYWKLPELYEESLKGVEDEEDLLDELEALLESSVERQLVADVPVGILLSGGVDSSLITAMASRKSSQIQTFSIGFPGYGKIDETGHARLVAKHFGTQHTELIAEPASANLLPILAKQFDEPMVDSSMIPSFLVSQLVRKHCKVALGGDGGDELFAGYGHYSRLLWMQKRLSFIPYPFRSSIAFAAEKLLPVGMKGRNWLQFLSADLENNLPMITTRFDLTTRCKLIKSDNFHNIAEALAKSRVPSQDDLLQRSTRMDFENYLAEDLLVKVDRSSMLNSLEMRSPFLDKYLIEFAFGKVPSKLKANIFQKKILLKRLTERVLPSSFDRQRKQGFSIPLADWLKDGKFRELFNDVLRDSNCTFDSQAVNNLLVGQDRGYNNSERLFALVLFELWRREYGILF